MELSQERKTLISKLKRYGISDKVLAAMLKVPRHLFVPKLYQSSAYIDTPLSIGYGQTISAPHMVAKMCDVLDLKSNHKILEIGTGSGYNAAVMAEITDNKAEIYSIESIMQLTSYAKNNLKSAGYNNIEVILSDGSLGFKQKAPYDRICVTAASPRILPSLVDQLKKGGKMVIPVGDRLQNLYLIIKNEDGEISKQDFGKVIFVPLIGKQGF